MRIDDPWLELDIVWRDGAPALTDRRHDGSEAPAPGERRTFETDGLRFAADLPSWIRTVAGALGPEAGPHSTGPRVLPIFWRPSRGPLAERPVAATALLEQWLEDVVGVDLSRVIVLPRCAPRQRRRRPFALPLTVLGAGEAGALALDQIRRAPWFTPEVEGEGMALTRLGPDAAAADIAVARVPDAPEALRRAARGRPRLMIAVASGGDPGAWIYSDAMLRDACRWSGATLWMERGLLAGTDFVPALTVGVVHDLPLHQAYAAALRETLGLGPLRHARPLPAHWRNDPAAAMADAEWALPAVMLADRVAVQNLRLRDTALEMYQTSLDQGFDMVASPERMARVARRAARVSGRIGAAVDVMGALAGVLRSQDAFVLSSADFTSESGGFEPLAAAARALRTLRAGTAAAARGIARGMDDAARADLAQAQERRVDVRLLRRTPPPYAPFEVGRNDRVETGGRYRLRVNVGPLSEASLVIARDGPSFDALLPVAPAGRGHQLSVVVDPLDFRAEGPMQRRLDLPPVGPSRGVAFDVAAPSAPGPARLRVLVYLERGPEEAGEAPRNHLVQSLLLTTEAADDGGWSADAPTRVVVELSKTLNFGNLDAMPRHALSLAFNEDPLGGAHNMVLKVGEEAKRFHLTEAVMARGLALSRRILRNAAFEDPDGLHGPRFAGAAEREEDRDAFRTAVRALAKLGMEQYRATVRDPLSFADAARLRTAADETVAIAPMHPMLYPWQILYDALEPAADAPVCEGFRRRDDDGAPLTPRMCLDQCLHGDRSGAYCVYGFWGARFAIEQPFGARDVPQGPQAVPARSVGVSVGLKRGPALRLARDLAADLGEDRVAVLSDAPPLVDRLWAAEDRPGLLLVVGHAEMEPGGDGIEGQPRMTLPGGRWLHPRDLWNKLDACAPLTAPAPVLVLAACESARSDPSRWVGFVEPLGKAEAAGVVGVEIPVAQDFAVALSRTLARSLCGPDAGRSLIEAVLAFRRERLLRGDPLGFCVTSFGDARFAVPAGEGTP